MKVRLRIRELTEKRARLAKQRQPFPSPEESLAALDDGALIEWIGTCTVQQFIHGRWGMTGRRWRRAMHDAQRELAARASADAGTPRRPCENCGQRPPTHHVVYPPKNAPRFAHYCAGCSPSMPHGFMSIVEADD
jgi:hypothetical protein